VMKTARRHGLQIPSRVLGIYRALLVAEMVASELEAKVDVPSVGRAFFEQLQLDHARRALEPRNAAPTALSLFGLARDGPGQLHQVLSELADGTFALNIYGPRVARARNWGVRPVASSFLTVGVALLITAIPAVLYLSILIQWRRLR
jgi:hypothetical protein